MLPDGNSPDATGPHDRGAGRSARASSLRRWVAAGSAAVLILAWNAVQVLGTRGGQQAGALSGAGANGSIDVTAPVVTRQS